MSGRYSVTYCRCGRRKAKYASSCDVCCHAVMVAAQDERQRFNEALRNGAKAVLLDTFNGQRVVEWVDSNWWYHVKGETSFAGCNDGTWANLLQQAGVPRNPAFAK